MNKEEILQKFTKPEDKLLVAKILDKITFAKMKNKIINTEMLDLYQKSIAEKIVLNDGVKSIFFGGYEGAERTCLILYPEKLDEEIVRRTYKMIFKLIRIKLPNDLKGKYQHKNYLGAIMKTGIKREKVGDILTREDGADIIVQADIAEYLSDELSKLTRFSKAEIGVIEIDELLLSSNKKEEIDIIVQSIRLDSIVSELIKTSRTKAEEIIYARKSIY